ncbi:cell volume regulation protein A [Parabacteroides sp. PF5-5]|uniref:potassium/proton antiporter n=1 Tax=unclassified Parabacteroides TaxID=2649774 RepID=UPI00247649EB|nr:MULTISPECIES: potassium/proton antiporter [unclassified Parabacteroides]MDH6306879.1 cell volume regulation protein A [Parabacteroides sp. PH5-39]MDH6317733.1 cell volume regulation protein A [Parabacteroides sp. PF5-13]MDH6321605.1 cell volume regulation protein A [Parabacteroides sp. PH5-13]MDH6325266.1 cell volume regulation protein A [Parabacteroides sp. PH5-8]MDH6328918.1 cell volume regulation protein A [Parabacteroides sp. PH5-41]
MLQDLQALFDSAESILLIVSVILFFSIVAGKAGFRVGLPSLLIFLGVGMLFGSDGLGIQFSNPNAAQFIGMLALSIILFSGGMDTKFSDIKPIATQGVILATFGVLATTFITGGFIYYMALWATKQPILTFPESLLMAAVMSSTDSASVFSILRSKGIYLKEKLRPTLELESGSNDPMAYMLTLLMISYIQTGGMNLGEAVLSLVVQLVWGAAAGYLLGRLLVWIINHINMDNASMYPILLLAGTFFIFAITTLLKGNGYLAVYIAGLVVGNSKLIHKKSIGTFLDGFTWLWQIVMFLTLGLLVNPHELLSVAVIGLTVGVFMIIVARPVSVFLSLLPFKNFSFKGKCYISWVGLRGAVPIIFATYPLTAGIEHAGLIFNVVFFITILSLLIQGTTVTTAAKVLGMVDEPERKDVFGIELPDGIKSAMSEIEVTSAVLEHGNKLMELTLPDHTLAVMVMREGRYFIPKGDTILKEGDILLMISDNDEALLQSYEALGITDYTMKKN